MDLKRFTIDEAGLLYKDQARHPIVEDDVVIYAGAIFRRITISRTSTLGGNLWLTCSVPSGSSVTQANLQHLPGNAG